MSTLIYQDIKPVTGDPVISLKPDGIFDTPVQFAATQDSFDTSIKHIESWIVQLPMADAKLSARELIDRLEEINHIDIAKRHRLKVLELLTHTVFKTTHSLKQHYITQGLPLSDKGYDSARLVEELNGHFAMGYKIYIEQSWHSNISLLNRKTMAQVIYRAMFILGETLINAYESYRDPTPYVWLQIHQLYYFARQKHLEHITLSFDEQNEHAKAKSILSLYKKILLVGLISPYRLRQIITDKVYIALDSWNEYTDVVAFDRQAQNKNCAIINLHSDSAPSFYSPDMQANDSYDEYLMIDTSGLVEYLNEIMLQKNNTRNFSADAADIPYNVLKILLITWNGTSKRAFSRANTQNKIGVTIGLSATHFFIHKLEQINSHTQSSTCQSAKSVVWNINLPVHEMDSHEDPELELPANFNNPLSFQVNNNAVEQNYWDANYTATSVSSAYSITQHQKEQQQKIHNNESTLYHPLHYDNVNESADGLCLIGHIERSDEVHKVKIGDLVGICSSTNTSDELLNLGVIRRVRCSDEEIKLGIQKLAPCAEAIAACTFQINRKIEQYSRSLVLPELKSINQPVTVITNKLHTVNERLILNKRGYKTVVKLTKLIESTDVFSQFEFSISHVLGFENEIEKELELEEPQQTSEWSII